MMNSASVLSATPTCVSSSRQILDTSDRAVLADRPASCAAPDPLLFFRPSRCGLPSPEMLDRGHLRGIAGGVRCFSSDELPAHTMLEMPKLSPTEDVTGANLLEWKKKEGEAVAAGDVLFLVETDKATVEEVSQEDGFLAKILVPGGSNDVKFQSPVGILVEEEGDMAAFGNFDSGSSGAAESTSSSTKEDSASESSSSPEKEDSASAPSSAPPTKKEEYKMPEKLWPSARRLLVESGIDPATVTATGPHGVYTKWDVQSAIDGGRSQKTSDRGPEEAQESQKEASPTPSPSPSKSEKPAKSEKQAQKQAPSQTGMASPGQGEFTDIPMSQMRKTWQPDMLSTFMTEAILDGTLKLRKELKEKHSVSISVNDFVIKAVAVALKQVPEANVHWDNKLEEVVANKSIDICVAVATDKGLLTPIVKDADKKSLSMISAEVKSLAEKARTGKLKPEEFTGGSFTISNLGMYPVDRFTAIINPPQAGILAVGRGDKVAKWQEDPDGTGGKPVTVTKMEVALSADHRALEGEAAGNFLAAVTANLEEPARLLL
eukprot:SM000155S01657  [mRNA]  locus=s155:81577:87163:- [translate_table: standard]